jgi:hypothetical protein
MIMQFHITATVDNGGRGWTTDLGTHECTTRSELNAAIHALHAKNAWVKDFSAREAETRIALAYRPGPGGWFEPVGKQYGGPFRGFENA